MSFIILSEGRAKTELFKDFYCVYPNIRKEFFSNSPSEKWGVVLILHAKVNTFCVGTFLQTEDYEVEHPTFGYIVHLQIARNFIVQREL